MLARAASFCLLSAALATLSAPAAAADAWLLSKGENHSTLTGDFLHAKTYRSADGSVRLDLGGSTEERTVAYRATLGWLSGTNFFFEVPWRSVSRVLPGQDRYVRDDPAFGASLPDTAGSRSGLGDLGIGFRQALIGGKGLVVSLEGRWDVPLSYESRGGIAPQDTILSDSTAAARDPILQRLRGTALGPDQQSVSGTFNIGIPLTGLRGFFQASGGYRYVLDSDADQLIGSADLVLGLTPALQLGGRWRGAIASGDAEEGGLEQVEHLVGPVLVYRVDDRLDVFGGSWHTAEGENVLHKNQVYVGLSFKQTRLNRSQGFLGGARP